MRIDPEQNAARPLGPMCRWRMNVAEAPLRRGRGAFVCCSLFVLALGCKSTGGDSDEPIDSTQIAAESAVSASATPPPDPAPAEPAASAIPGAAASAGANMEGADPTTAEGAAAPGEAAPPADTAGEKKGLVGDTPAPAPKPAPAPAPAPKPAPAPAPKPAPAPTPAPTPPPATTPKPPAADSPDDTKKRTFRERKGVSKKRLPGDTD